MPLARHGEGRGAMRKRLMVLLMAVMVVMTAAPALAAKDGPRPGEPEHPTCTKAEPKSPVIEPIPGGGGCFVTTAGPK